jgi:hypothetical protein
MNSRKIAMLSLVIGTLAAGTAMAGSVIGTAKARGDFGSFGRETQQVTRYRPAYSYRAPATYSAPAVQTAPAPMVAQAPEAGRRFSYAPATPSVTGSPCPQAQTPASAPAVESARRYSYAPTAESTVAPAMEPSARTYGARPSYSGGGRGRSTVDRWALPKTDPRKFND